MQPPSIRYVAARPNPHNPGDRGCCQLPYVLGWVTVSLAVITTTLTGIEDAQALTAAPNRDHVAAEGGNHGPVA